MWDYLNRKGLKQIDEEQALAAVKRGAVIVDVRLAGDYAAEHIQGALSVPLFRLTAGDGGWDKVKRVGGGGRLGGMAAGSIERGWRIAAGCPQEPACLMTNSVPAHPPPCCLPALLPCAAPPRPALPAVCDGQPGNAGHGTGPRLPGAV